MCTIKGLDQLMMDWLLYAIAFYGFLFLVRYLLFFLHFKKLTIQYPQHEIQPNDRVPAYLKSLFKQPVTELNQLGFKFCSFLQLTPMVKLDFPRDWEVLLYHPTRKTYAILSIRQGIEPTNLFNITFYSFFKDKSLLMTLNGISYGVLGEIPNTILQDPYTADLQVHWQTHESRLQQLETTTPPVALAPAMFLDVLQHHLKGYIDHQVKAQHIAPIHNEPLFRWKNWALLKALPRISKGAKRENAIAKQRQQRAKTNPSLQVEIPIELEVRQFQRMEQLQKSNGQSKLNLWVVGLSFLVFVAVYTPLMSPERLAIFVGVLLLHEGGHVLAMKLCGYRDTSMLFLPFLGALATARKDDATLTQKFWVSFAGPIPGLILGIGLAIANRDGHYPEWITEASWMLIGLNLFNLLPVYPLDGGQIADLLVFSRVPLLGVVFKSIGVLLLILLGFGKPMLMGFGVLIGLTIPITFRSDRMNAKLRKEFSQLQSDDPETLLSLIFAKLKQSGQAALPFSKKYALAKTVMQRRSEARAKWTTQLSLSLLYSFSLIGGFVGVLEATVPQWQSFARMALEDRTTRAKQEIEKATAAIAANPKDIDAYLKRGRMQLVLKKFDAAIADANRVIELDPNTSKAYALRGAARRALGDKQAAKADSEKAIVLEQAQLLEKTNQRLRSNPNDVGGYLIRARVLSFQKNHKNAIADYNQVLRLDPKRASAYFERGSVWNQLKNYKRAIADVDQAIRLNANLTDAYELRAELRRQLGDEAGAKADDRKFEELLKKNDHDAYK